MLETNSTLSILDFSLNKIGYIGAKKLASVLESNHNIKEVDLSCNNIGDVGAKRLALALKSNPNLVALSLRHNQINKVVVNKLIAVLKSNYTLIELDLFGNEIGNEGLEIIKEYLGRNKAIAEKKAEALNTEGNDLYNQEKYNEAIEKYKAAIKIKKGFDRWDYNDRNSYEKSKIKAEKKYEKQKAQILLENDNKIIDNPHIDDTKVLGGDNIVE